MYSGDYAKETDAEIDSLFNWFTPILRRNFPQGFAPYYTNPTDRSLNDEYTSIIQQPQIRLKQPMINFDINQNINDINTMINTPATSYTSKFLGVIIKGHGGGKTRALEEIKMTLNAENNGCLAVAITYDFNWYAKDDECMSILSTLYPTKTDKSMYIRKVGIIYSIITRMTSMLYGYPLHIVQDIYNKEVINMPKISIISFRLVLIAFIKATIVDMRTRGGGPVTNLMKSSKNQQFETRFSGRPVTSLVVLIDETKLINNIFEKYTNDLFKGVIETILGEQMEEHIGIKAALVLSSSEALHLG